MSDAEARVAMAKALAPFGWTCTDEFWERYAYDAWVFNLANAVERLTAERDALRAENVDLLASREYWVQTRTDEISRDLAALVDENARLRALTEGDPTSIYHEAAALRERHAGVEYERDLFAEIVRDPAKLLNHLLDARGVMPWVGLEYEDGSPAAIRIPADLSRAVFGSLVPCGPCAGTGEYPSTDGDECSHCGGTGEVWATSPSAATPRSSDA